MTVSLYVMFLANIVMFVVNMLFTRDNAKAADELIRITEKHCREMRESLEEWERIMKEWSEKE